MGKYRIMGRYKETIFNLLLVFVGVLLFILGYTAFGISIDLKMFIIMLAFMLMLDNLAIKYTDIKISISPIIAIASFLVYGIITATILSILSIMVETILIRRKLKNGILNGAMFAVVYIIAGFIFNAIGGKIGLFSLSQLKYIIIYVMSSFIINHFILYYILMIQGKILFKQYWNETTIVELLAYLIMIPLGIFMANIYLKYGMIYFIMHGIPIILLGYFLRVFNNLKKANQRLNAMYEMIKIINSKLELKETFEAIIYATKKAISISSMAIYMKDESGLAIKCKLDCPEGKVKAFKDSYSDNECLIGKAISTGKSIIVGNLKKNKICYDKDIAEYFASAMVIPIKSSGQVIGCLSVFQSEPDAFDNDSIKIMEALSEQASIAIINAKSYSEISRKSIEDPLTKVYNRRFFDQALYSYVLRARENNIPVSLIMIDVDKFKNINDTYGHIVGDQVLCEIAERIKKCLRSNDIVSRYGGEEFTVILQNLTAEQAFLVAERIRYEVSSKPIKIGKSNIYITISAGIADYPFRSESAEKLVSHADRALYAGSKTKGRNRVAIYIV